MRFVFLESRLCLRLPSDPASRRRPCLQLTVPVTKVRRGLSPPSSRPCRAHPTAGRCDRQRLLLRCLHVLGANRVFAQSARQAQQPAPPVAPARRRPSGRFLLREEGGETFLLERGRYAAYRAVERRSNPHEREQIRQQDTTFQVTDVTLPQPSPLGQYHLCHLPLLAQFAYAIPDQFAGART
jgi:hypothetical protein